MVVVLLLTMMVAPASAEPWTRDPDFGFGGIVELELGFEPRVNDLVVQPDGKILVVGFSKRTENADVFQSFLLRVGNDGAPDPRFGTKGVVFFAEPESGSLATQVALQSDGMIVVAGSAPPPTFRRLIYRFGPDGQRDMSYGLDGLAGFGDDLQIRDMHVLDGDKLLTVAYNGRLEASMNRYLPNGAPDVTFGVNGKLQWGMESMAMSPGRMTVWPDGSAAIGGRSYPATILDGGRIEEDFFNGDVFITKVTSGGKLDDSFGEGGTQFVGDLYNDVLGNIHAMPDGGVAVSGTGHSDRDAEVTEKSYFVARLDSTGAPATSFGEGGVVREDADPNGPSLRDSVLQENGRIAALLEHGPRLLRLNADGSRDTTVGADGVSPALVNNGYGANNIALSPDGSLVVAYKIGTSEFALLRVEGDPVEVDEPPAPSALQCNGLDVTVDLALGEQPTNGDDVILGTNGRDRIKALGGDDVICGLGGNDIIKAGAGSDWVDAGAGNDKVIGGGGVDELRGGAGKDFLKGGGGKDVLVGGDDNDKLDGGPGVDQLDGGKGTDSCKASSAKKVKAGKGDKLRRCD